MTHAKSAKSIKLVIDSNLEMVFLVGLAVKALCSHAPLSEVAVYQVELSVIEAVNNAIKHAYGNEKGHEVEIWVSLHVDRLTFQIGDSGRSMNEIHAPAMDYDPGDLEALPESGMGLYIMQSVMDRVEYHRRGERNVLTLSKFFEKNSEPPLAEARSNP
ncbi:MAG: hypothetical protein AUK55_15475 [Syntrophobacteraceae bacterium CG2_30_61_12]|nr:MAG: hypothetical protein AUK55_15475 [Syntrophobacteraceae bacterium CG2_30_61_12]